MTQSNIDLESIQAFNKMAEDWWDPKGVCKPLHQINPLRLKFIMDQVGSLKNQRVLDVGCGGGLLSEAMAQQGAQVIGLDPAAPLVNVAVHHASQQGLSIEYTTDTVESFSENSPEPFSVITCMELLEHVPDPKALIQSCMNLLKPQGWLIFSTINRNFEAWFLTILGAEYVLRWLPRGTHQYDQFITPNELSTAVQALGLKVIDLKGIRYRLLSRTWHLSTNTRANYLLCCQK